MLLREIRPYRGTATNVRPLWFHEWYSIAEYINRIIKVILPIVESQAQCYLRYDLAES